MDIKTTRSAFAAALAATGLAAAGLAPLAAAQTHGRLTLVSVDPNGGQTDDGSFRPAVSADGSIVAFESDATNLVPGDTNDQRDIFVRDRATDVTERVSVTWNGMEALGDSQCPAISADGRYVAFLSRAWNMVERGANLGTPRWDVYVHDREDGSTTRVSRAHDGGDPDGWSYCPSMSGDGTRIAFASDATNLVSDDANGFTDVFVVDRTAGTTTRVSIGFEGAEPDSSSFQPAISGDGRLVAFASNATNFFSPSEPPSEYGRQFGQSRVLLRDLESGALEVVSKTVDDPIVAPDSDSGSPSLSQDGRFVAFTSSATNLVFPFPNAVVGDNVFVRDRFAGSTVMASVHDPAIFECGREGYDFFCKPGRSYSPAISRDGRFVAFTSRSLRLLPENEWGGSQIYLFDRTAAFLRRISVDAVGAEGDSCSEEPVLSQDGEVVVFRTTSANLLEADANATADIVAHEWLCGAGGNCRRMAACPARPPRCARADASKLRLVKRAPGGVGKDGLFWRWSAAPGQPFPAPEGAAGYQLCLYEGERRALAMDLAVDRA